MTKKERTEKVEKQAKPVDTTVPDFVYWEKVTGKALSKFVLTASIRDVTGTFTSEGKRFRTDMRGLAPAEIIHWMQAVHTCIANNPAQAAEYLTHNRFTVDLDKAELFEEETSEVTTVIMDGESAETEIETDDETFTEFVPYQTKKEEEEE
jgi:hypothetical protein